MKTPDEIKKGLECARNCSENDLGCSKCPYLSEDCSDLHPDALAYIQQLEAERDAAVKDMPTSCKLCKHFQPKTCTCKSKKPCARIRGVNTEWQWRGVQKED